MGIVREQGYTTCSGSAITFNFMYNYKGITADFAVIEALRDNRFNAVREKGNGDIRLVKHPRGAMVSSSPSAFRISSRVHKDIVATDFEPGFQRGRKVFFHCFLEGEDVVLHYIRDEPYTAKYRGSSKPVVEEPVEPPAPSTGAGSDFEELVRTVDALNDARERIGSAVVFAVDDDGYMTVTLQIARKK